MAYFVRFHGLPSVIISDRYDRFTSNFSKSLFELLNTKLSMSTAFHPQSNGQTEIINRYLEQALRHYTDVTQSDWDIYLTHIEIAHNDSIHMTTKYSQYYLNYGFNPVFPKDLLNAANVETVKQTFFKLDEIRKLANDNITSAQQRQKYYVDNSRRVNVGDSVLLSTKVIFETLLSSFFQSQFKLLELTLLCFNLINYQIALKACTIIIY